MAYVRITTGRMLHFAPAKFKASIDLLPGTHWNTWHFNFYLFFYFYFGDFLTFLRPGQSIEQDELVNTLIFYKQWTLTFLYRQSWFPFIPWQSYRVTGLLWETASKHSFLVCMGSPTRISSLQPNVNTCREHIWAVTTSDCPSFVYVKFLPFFLSDWFSCWNWGYYGSVAVLHGVEIV